MRRSIIAAALALLGLGCWTESAHAWHGDERFSAEERAAIESGARWMAEHVGREPARIVWDAPHPDDDATCTAWTIIRRDARGARFDGPLDCIVIGAQNPPKVEILAAHEFGHYYGLGHTVQGVMQPSVAASLVWSDDDERECVRVGACR